MFQTNVSTVLLASTASFPDLTLGSHVYVPRQYSNSSVIRTGTTWFSNLGAINSGNVMGFDTWLTDAGILWLTQARVETEEQEAYARVLLSAETAEVEDLAKSLDADLGWRYLNYVDPSQDPLSSYGASNVQYIRKVAAKYDPKGVFQTQIPGATKISKVPS